MKSPQQKLIKDTNSQSQRITDKFRQSKGQFIFDEQTAPCSRQLMHSKLVQLNDKQLQSLVRKRDYRRAISVLNDLQSQINAQHNQFCRTDKLLYYHQLSVCYYNHAAVYQKVNNDEQTANYFQKSLKNLQYMQGYINNRQESVSYSIQLAKLRIQFCSILSQNGKHQEAITFAEKALQKIIESFRILEAICFEIIMANRLPQTNFNSRESRTKIQLVNFKTQVLYEAEKLLKQLSSLPQAHQLTIQFKKKYDSLMQKMFFWKDNAENNQKLLRKQLQIQRKQVNSQRNILGVQKNSVFSQNLTLESLTNLEIKSINYTFKTDPFLLLSVPKLTEMAFYVSMIYFMLATQIRFSQNDLNVNKLRIEQKYKKLSRDQRMIKCKMIHMKAIEIAGKFLPQKNEFFSHILNRFNKNYKCVMEEINEESRQQSMKDIESLKVIQSEKQIFPQDQYGISRNQSLINSLNIREDNPSCVNSPSMISSMNSPILGSLKKIKKNKTIILSQNLQQPGIMAKKRKLSTSKQKQDVHNFHKHKRSASQSHNHKRTLSSQKLQKSNSFTKLISVHKIQENQQNRQRLKTVDKIGKKHEQKMFKKHKYEQNLIEKQKVVNYSKCEDRKQKIEIIEMSRQKRRILISPEGMKRKLSSCKIKLRSQQNSTLGNNNSDGKSNKKFLFHKKQINNNN